MTSVLAAAVGLLVVGGLLMIISGRRRSEVRAPRRGETFSGAWARLTRRPAGNAGRRRDALLLYAQLRRLSDQLELPELRDLADIMQLDENGAALSGALRARLQELRDAHLTREQMAASAAAEGMTIYMTLPALIFGLIFLGAALLRILEG